MELNKTKTGHVIILNNRQRVEMTGIEAVVSFNEENVLLNTVMGALNIKGKNMKVNKLNVENGDMCIEGEVVSIQYLNKEVKNKEGIIKRLFK